MPPRASGRMLRRTISESAHFAALSPEAAVLFVMLIPHFNAHGKMPGGPGWIKDEVVPLIPYLDYGSIPGLLREISGSTNVKWFKVGPKWWIHALDFHDHQELRSDRMGDDDLPSWPGEESGADGDAQDTGNIEFPENSGSSPGVVPESPSRAEVKKVRSREEQQQQQYPPISPLALEIGDNGGAVEHLFRKCFEENEAKLSRLFPDADFPVERELCVAFYRKRAPPLDPLPVVLKWFQRIRNGKGGDNGCSQVKGGKGRARGIVQANGPDADWLGG